MQSEGEQYQPSQVSRVIQTFNEHLDSIETVTELPDLQSHLNHDGKYMRVREELPAGLYVDPKHPGLSVALNEAASFWYQPQPGRRVGREDSHNAVNFGRLWLSPEESPDTDVQVAVKSMEPGRHEVLKAELASFQFLGKTALLPTFEPAALLIHSDGHGHLLTHFDSSVSTMDTVEWSELNTAEAWQQLEPAIATMAMLHTNGIFHGDLYFKNVAFDVAGKPIIVDPELSTSARNALDALVDAPIVLNEEQSRLMHAVKRHMSRDVSALTNSIETHILKNIPKRERPRTSEAKLKLYRQHLLGPYKQLLVNASEDSPYAPVLLRAYDLLLASFKERAQNDTL